MTSPREAIYLGRDNAIELLLEVGGVVQDLSGVTSGVTCLQVVLGGVTISSITSSTLFDWQDWTGTSGTTVGWVKLMLGGATAMTPGNYDAELIVYNPQNTNGILWGTIPVKVSG